MRSLLTPLLACVLLGACTLPPAPPIEQAAAQNRTLSTLDSTDALDELVRINAQSGDAQRAERTRLDGERLGTARLQFRLALLLGRDDDPASQERALKLLGSLDTSDARAQALVDLTRTSLKAQLDARRQASRTQELQARIEQLKALEKSLQQRDDAPKPR
ncbi:MAG: hypothetical protein B7Y26_02790 [Hydrogenophilales bacterium 16-64-46]|nr:MAG: hypothetical protein B7Z32_02490 [Hydrogenophilales bacterium 12-64-13]OYZ06739.1 MAG: hypothetical protein B7Y26_02790 [Hydrogenophilales bacterium 16-64-46]OZA39447.1 MAG: hypothetical protein B7X87_03895 [Hydrogenophilales bacterium 17-64-34]HQT01207.1 hypothetical protein [Thiobacillus sp.]